jgi:uncharacterized protein YbjT (DUF2867 family)
MILVTGATGDVGGGVVRRLVAAGAPVRVLARDPNKAAALGTGVAVALGDLMRPETFAAALAGVQQLFLMAHAGDLPAVAAHAAPAARAAGVRHVVLLSSSTVLIDPIPTIGKLHLAAEQAVEAAGLSWTMLRPGNFASNTLRWAPTIKAQGAVFAPAGEIESAPIDPEDIAQVAARALSEAGHAGKRYVLTGEERMSAARQVEIIGSVIGKPLRFVDVPKDKARAGMIRSGMSEHIADAILELIGRPASGELLSTTTVREVTGVAPRSFESWVRAHRAAFE